MNFSLLAHFSSFQFHCCWCKLFLIFRIFLRNLTIFFFSFVSIHFKKIKYFLSNSNREKSVKYFGILYNRAYWAFFVDLWLVIIVKTNPKWNGLSNIRWTFFWFEWVIIFGIWIFGYSWTLWVSNLEIWGFGNYRIAKWLPPGESTEGDILVGITARSILDFFWNSLDLFPIIFGIPWKIAWNSMGIPMESWNCIRIILELLNDEKFQSFSPRCKH